MLGRRTTPGLHVLRRQHFNLCKFVAQGIQHLSWWPTFATSSRECGNLSGWCNEWSSEKISRKFSLDLQRVCVSRKKGASDLLKVVERNPTTPNMLFVQRAGHNSPLNVPTREVLAELSKFANFKLREFLESRKTNFMSSLSNTDRLAQYC